MKASIVLLPFIVFLAACTSFAEKEATTVEDNDLAYRLRYTDISASLQAAKQAYLCPSASSDEKAEALNNMAYVCYQQMRYDRALQLLRKIKGISHNQLELLCADVLTMKVMQRIGRGKSFFGCPPSCPEASASHPFRREHSY